MTVSKIKNKVLRRTLVVTFAVPVGLVHLMYHVACAFVLAGESFKSDVKIAWDGE